MQKISQTILLILVTLSPLLFWTFTPNFFASPKQVLLLVSVLALLLLWLFPLIKGQAILLPRTPLTLPIFFFISALFLNLILIPEARTEGLIGRGSLYIAAALLTLFATTLSQPSFNRRLLNLLIVSSTIVSLQGILQLTFLHTLTSLPAFLQLRSFSLVGTPHTALIIILLGLVASTTWAFLTKNNEHRLFLLLTTAIQTIAAIAYLSLMLGGGELAPAVLPLRASWSIALDALKTPRSFLIGVGLANFPALFTAVKPLYLNLTPLWNFLPANSGSELLTILTTGGFLLLLPLLLLFVQYLHALRKGLFKQSEEQLVLASLVFASILALLLTPASLSLVVIFFLSLGLLFPAPKSAQITLPPGGSYSAVLLGLGLVGLVSFYSAKVVLAENDLRRAQLALEQADAQTVYQAHLDAINLVPSMTSYHLSYSQINLTLAAGLSQQADLTDEQRNQIGQLINQAVAAARNGASLRPSLSTTWTNLASVYTNLVNVAEGAEEFAVQYFQQAVNLDPANPALRFQFGSFYYQLAGLIEDDEATQLALLTNAAREFQTAVQLKPDYANAWYNLSKTYESAGNYQAAYEAMQQVLASLDPNSPDLATATSELEALQDKLPAPSPTATPAPSGESSSISEPSPLPSPLPGGPIELPEGSPLPSPSITPTPTPSPSSSPSPSPSSSPTPIPEP